MIVGVSCGGEWIAAGGACGDVAVLGGWRCGGAGCILYLKRPNIIRQYEMGICSMAATEEKFRLDREIIAMRVAKELQDGDVVNLGIGIPSLCSQFVPEGRDVLYHSESGVMNFGPMAEEGEEDVDLTNASGHFLAWHPGMSFFHSADAFAMIRGGHIDVTVLGALQVSASGDLANWNASGARCGQRGRRDGSRGGCAGGHCCDGAYRPRGAVEGCAGVQLPFDGQGLC